MRRPNVPAAWTKDTSFEQWLPDAKTRAEFDTLLAKAARASAKEKTKLYKAAAKLLPAQLRNVHPTGASAIASPQVERIILELVAYVCAATEAKDVVWAHRELERISPDLPGLSVRDPQALIDALAPLVERRRTARRALLSALEDFDSYVSSS